MTNQSYIQPLGDHHAIVPTTSAGGPHIRSPASNVKPPGTTVPGHSVDPKSPAGSLVAVPIIETQIGQIKSRTLATATNIHHLPPDPAQPFTTTATADAYPDPGRFKHEPL